MAKSFKLSQNVAYSISFHMKKFNLTVIVVRLRLEALKKMHLLSKMARFLGSEISQIKLWQKQLKIILIIPYGNSMPKL